METRRREMVLRNVMAMIAACCVLAGCGGVSTVTAPPPTAAPAVAAPPEAPRPPDPDLHRPPPRRVLDLDWATLPLATEADALAAWHRIAPTGADWDDKVAEIPAAAARPLALAVIRGGNFACVRPPPAAACMKPAYDVPPPADIASFDDPCLRRLLALWAMAQLEDDDLPAIHPALRAIAALPPPESQLVASAITAVPEAAFDDRLELIALAWQAGQRDLVESVVGKLDDAHLVDALRRHHVASALELLAVVDHRPVYLAAITDEALVDKARIRAIAELAEPDLGKDVRAALVTATRARSCVVAAAAARALDQAGDHRFVPRRPQTTSPPALMRAMCVLAGYEAMQRPDEASLLASYLPARGLERITITYDALSEADPDGDGDPHTTHSAELVARGDAVLPEVVDLSHAMQHCTGTICVSDDHEFRFVWTAGRLTRLEVAERPTCPPAP